MHADKDIALSKKYYDTLDSLIAKAEADKKTRQQVIDYFIRIGVGDPRPKWYDNSSWSWSDGGDGEDFINNWDWPIFKWIKAK